jgi:hypothetical protein
LPYIFGKYIMVCWLLIKLKYVRFVLHCRSASSKVIWFQKTAVPKMYFPYISFRGAVYQWTWGLPENTGPRYRDAAAQCCHLYKLAVHPLWQLYTGTCTAA